MKTKNLIACFIVCFVIGLLTSGCVTILTKPEPTPTNTPIPTNTPEPTSTPVPIILSSGTIDIPQTYLVDLDSGIVPTDPKDSSFGAVDLWFEAISREERFLEPYNGASWAVIGPSAVGFNECKAIPPTAQRADIKDLPSGTYICVTTNVGNISVVRINSIDMSNVGTIKIDFTTWQQP